MPKITRSHLEEIIASSEFQEILEIIASLKTSKEVELFFRDAFTPKELGRFQNRWIAIKWVRKKDVPYREIVQKTGISLATLYHANENLNDDFRGWEFFLQKSKGETDNPLRELFEILSSCKKAKEIELFFRDGVTRLEMYKVRKRWMVVKMLDQNIPYRKIAQEIGIALSTVFSISNTLRQGSGWKLVLQKAKKSKKD
ncbi:MAG: Trp operon repressor [Syntrophomonadaceae bacterium]|nr:Trp operon repressor [Bacillota bacterium]